MKSTMHKVLTGAILVSALATGNLFAQYQVANGPHDLTGGGPVDAIAGPLTDKCRFCHTPHNAVDPTTNTVKQLWDRNGPETATFTMYDSTTLTAGNAVSAPEGVSLACLSCHDGATAFDSLQGVASPDHVTNTLGAIAPTSTANFGASLANDHPISIGYVVAGTEVKAITGPEGAGLTFYGGTTESRVVGTSGQVECATCHDPHGNPADYFLRIPTATGNLCETCHNK